jgi:predicted N-acetyltransferase YhbS
MKIVHCSHTELAGELNLAVQALLKRAFPDVVGDYYATQIPDRIMLLWNMDRLVGHIAGYIRLVSAGDEILNIGLVGGVAVEPEFQSQGHAKRLLREMHGFFAQASLPFSVLFAFEPEYYRTSGYRTMTNETRFVDSDGTWKQFVFRGGMVAELGELKWPNRTLDLRGPAV